MALRVSQAVLTALLVRPTASPTTPDANTVAVSQAVLTALINPPSAARVAQAVLTALINPSDGVDEPGGCPEPEPGSGGTRIYGWG